MCQKCEYCKERKVGCHSTCSSYLQFKDGLMKIKKARIAENKKWAKKPVNMDFN